MTRLSYNADSNNMRVVAKASVVVARISTRLASDKEEGERDRCIQDQEQCDRSWLKDEKDV